MLQSEATQSGSPSQPSRSCVTDDEGRSCIFLCRAAFAKVFQACFVTAQVFRQRMCVKNFVTQNPELRIIRKQVKHGNKCFSNGTINRMGPNRVPVLAFAFFIFLHDVCRLRFTSIADCGPARKLQSSVVERLMSSWHHRMRRSEVDCSGQSILKILYL